MISYYKNPVVWFEIPVTDIRRASSFYENVFGYTISYKEDTTVKMGTFSMFNAPGISGALIQVDGYIPHHSGTVVYFSVLDIANTLEKVSENGGRVLIPKTFTNDGFIAHFEDSEGNQIGVYSSSLTRTDIETLSKTA
ncbi:MAG: VOC family protein [Chitinispirillaceae bacterium]|nr:VOC family protein [Chitinispirillaceae bacterium]